MRRCRRGRFPSTAGWALAELLTVVVLTGFFSTVLLQTTVGLKRCLAHWETSARMRQTLSAALFRMSRDFRVAGCNPKAETVSEEMAVLEDGGTAPERIRIRMDRRGGKPGSPPDGDMNDPDEVIVYRWDSNHRVLRRNNQPMAMRIGPNHGEAPVFGLTKQSTRGLVRIYVTTIAREQSMTLSSAVCIRNPVQP